MKYKNNMYKFQPNGEFKKKKTGKNHFHNSGPHREERAPGSEYLSFLLALRECPPKGNGLTFTRIKKCSNMKNDRAVMRLIDHAVRDGVLERENGLFVLSSSGRKRISTLEEKALNGSKENSGKSMNSMRGLEKAVMLRFKGTYGFARAGEGDSARDIFIPGKKLGDALPGDEVLLKVNKGINGQLDDGEVVKIVKPGNVLFSGVVRRSGRRVYVAISELGAEAALLHAKDVQDGERVTVKLLHGHSSIDRNVRYTGELAARFGNSGKAKNTAAAILSAAGIEREFSPEAMGEAEWHAMLGIPESEIETRADFREHPIFTIDSAESKDLDDAVEISFDGKEWTLGVHIADVSHYVRPGTSLDQEAMHRGTSIYYANEVVPMLPKALSNGICSLNPKEDRLAFSCLMTLDREGNLIDFDFQKSVIRSRVKGVYTEINRLLNGDNSAELKEKYADILPQLPLMKELASLRKKNRNARGVPEIKSNECKLILDDDGKCIDVKLRERGLSEEMIEEFMLLANESAAKLGKMLGIPFVYRVHDKPDAAKIEALSNLLLTLGQKPVCENPSAAELKNVLERAEGESFETLINRQVLRSMAKAAYDEKPMGHYGLVLEDYAHFTSPIRRYPDLAIHRILTAVAAAEKRNSEGLIYLPTAAKEKIEAQYEGFVKEAARRSSEAEVNAMKIERECEDSYKAEYMKEHIGEVFSCIISGAAAYGIYVETDRGIEGLIRIESLPQGEYQLDGAALKDTFSGRSYCVGDHINAKCVRTDVAEGEIDFIIEE